MEGGGVRASQLVKDCCIDVRRGEIKPIPPLPREGELKYVHSNRLTPWYATHPSIRKDGIIDDASAD